MGRLFGTDGVRGVANSEVTPEIAYKMGKAATQYFGAKHDGRPLVLIGRDTRLSGSMLEAALAAGICSAGGDALSLGVVPTPAVAYLAQKMGADAGVVISASHNPYGDNGIKYFAGDGYKLADSVEDELEELINNYRDLPYPTGEKVGTFSTNTGLIEQYIGYVVGTASVRLKGLKVVMDCSNGASYMVAPEVLRQLGAKVIVIHDRPNGININDNCGSTHMESLRLAVIANNADIGIANDGDADRCLAVDELGNIIDGDRIMLICALDLMKQGKLPDNAIVTTVMSNLGMKKAFTNAGGKLEITPVGDRYVLERMVEKNIIIGGEQSGHLIFANHSTTGDGVLTAVQLLCVLKRSGKKMSELAALMVQYPQILKNLRVKSRTGWQDNLAIKAAIESAETELGDDGRVLVRASGTEPLIRVMAEGPDEERLRELIDYIIAVIIKEKV
ncbi:MAG: phosphoglucosamine mutase [Bacillota bacterium]